MFCGEKKFFRNSLAPSYLEGMKRHFPLFIAVSVLLTAVTAELIALLSLNHGMFTYTMDDAYIHLSLAENIIHGHYGINPREFASVASSILWPFLLAPFAALPFGDLAPLIINILSSIATLALLHRIIRSRWNDDHPALATILLIVFTAATGMVGLIFTGMEHSLQVLSIVWVVALLDEALRGSVRSRELIIAIALTAIVRYEDLSVVLFAVTVLFVIGQRRIAASALFTAVALVGSFSLFLYYNEGTFLPTSVMAKMGSVQRSMAPFQRFAETVMTPFGALYASVAVIALAVGIRRKNELPAVVWSAGAFFVTLLDLLYGKVQYFGGLFMEFGYFFRYEMYLWSFLLVLLFLLFSGSLKRLYHRSAMFTIAFLLILEGVICGRNNAMLFSLPTASNNIYEQHAQMHRFATELVRGPVAVNDIGLVSYRNDAYVLDLWGLTSRDILAVRKREAGRWEWIDSLATAKGIRAAMVYDVWYPHLPPSWMKIGELTLTRKNVTASENVVSFYAIENAEELRSGLKMLRTEMPEEIRNGMKIME